MRAPLLPIDELDVTQLDRAGLLQRAQTLAYQTDPQWADFTLNHPENILLEAEALLISSVVHSMNERARQLSLATVTDRLAAIRLTRLHGFQLTGATAAQVDGYLYLPNSAVAVNQIDMAAGLRVIAGDAQYTLMSAATILAGANQTAALVTLENAETETEAFTSDEVANLVLRLSATPHIDDSITIVAGNGTYTTLDGAGLPYKSFLEMDADTLGYIALVDNNGFVYIFFGSGINGAIPTGTITVTHKVGGGTEGRVDADYPGWLVQDTVLDALGNSMTILFQNPESSVGGFAAMTTAEARVQAPQAARTIERCVNESDFEYVASLTSGIAAAAFLTSDRDVRMEENTGDLHVVAYGTPDPDTGYYPPARPTAAQIAEIEDNIAADGEYPAMLGLLVDVKPVGVIVAEDADGDGEYEIEANPFTDITIEVQIYKEANYTAALVRTSIDQALQKHFAVADDNKARNYTVDFGFALTAADGTSDYKLSWSAVMRAIQNAPGVREVSYSHTNLLLNGAHQSVILQPHAFPRLSTITIYDMDSDGVEI